LESIATSKASILKSPFFLKEDDTELIVVLTKKVSRLTARNKELQSELNTMMLRSEKKLANQSLLNSSRHEEEHEAASTIARSQTQHASDTSMVGNDSILNDISINLDEIRPTIGLNTSATDQQPQTSRLATAPNYPPLIITQISQETDFNTFTLVDQVKGLLSRLGLTVKEFSKIQSLSKAYLGNLIRNPEPWATLSEAKKGHYRKMHAWFVQNEHNSDENKILKPNMVSRKFQMKPAEHRGSLNTGEVARQLLELLNSHDISQGHFAQRKLFITKAYFDRLVTDPPAWEQLSEADKDIFRRFYKWTLAEPVEIMGLKRHMALYKARLQRNHNIRSFRTTTKAKGKKRSS
jgi:hypothetical protein